MLLRWQIEEIGYRDSQGIFQKSSPDVNIYVEGDGPGSRIPVARAVSLKDATEIVESHNALVDSAASHCRHAALQPRGVAGWHGSC